MSTDQDAKRKRFYAAGRAAGRLGTGRTGGVAGRVLSRVARSLLRRGLWRLLR